MNRPVPLSHYPTVGIIGPGRAGLGLALALRRAGVRVCGVHGRRTKKVPRGLALSVGGVPPWLGGADIILLAVRDDNLAPLVRQLSSQRLRFAGQVFLHLSGAQTSAVLAPLRRLGAHTGSMHPLMTVSAIPARAASHFKGATFVLEGDAAAIRAGRTIAQILNGAPVVMRASARARYHAGAVFASNYIVTALAAAERLLIGAGFTTRAARRALAPLARASTDNVAELGPALSLTGPIARGDVATLRKHLAVLDPATRRLYAALGRETLVLARESGLDAKRAASVRRLLKP